MPLQVECYIAEVTTARTLTQVLEETASAHGDSPALRQPVDGQPGGYLTYSWKQYLAAAREIAAGLDALGIKKGDVVALDSETRLEFYLADSGILANGSVAAAVYPSYPAADLVRTIETVGARAVFVENPKTLAALRTAKVEHWFLLTGEAEGAMTLAALRESGRSAMSADAALTERLRNRISPSGPGDSLSDVAAPRASRRWRWYRTRQLWRISIWVRESYRWVRRIRPWRSYPRRTSRNGW